MLARSSMYLRTEAYSESGFMSMDAICFLPNPLVMLPGATSMTVMPSSLVSWYMTSDRACKAAFELAYVPAHGVGMTPTDRVCQ